MNFFSAVLQKILRENGKEIFQDNDRFWALAANYSGEDAPEEMRIVTILAEKKLIPFLGEFHDAPPAKREQMIAFFEEELVKSCGVSEQELEFFFSDCQQAWGWKDAENRSVSASSKSNTAHQTATRTAAQQTQKNTSRTAAQQTQKTASRTAAQQTQKTTSRTTAQQTQKTASHTAAQQTQKNTSRANTSQPKKPVKKGHPFLRFLLMLLIVSILGYCCGRFIIAESRKHAEPIEYASVSEPTVVSEYIFPDSDTRELTLSDITPLSDEELRIARNEIFARHGRKFRDPDLQEYFNGCSWYQGTVEPDDFDSSVLNDTESMNIHLISSWEQSPKKISQ